MGKHSSQHCKRRRRQNFPELNTAQRPSESDTGLSPKRARLESPYNNSGGHAEHDTDEQNDRGSHDSIVYDVSSRF